MYGYSITRGAGIGLYRFYANAFLPHRESGRFMFGRLPIEYPVLSLIPMLVPLIGGSALYTTLFMLFMFAFVIGTYLFLLHYASRYAAFAYILYTLIGGFGIALGRLDVVLGTLILLSLYKAEKKKYAQAYILLALATMYKIVPLLLVVPLFVAEQHNRSTKKNTRSWKRFSGIILYCAACLLFFLVSYAIGGQQSLLPYAFGLSRPIQVESIPASILIVLAASGIVRICVAQDFASVNIYGRVGAICNSAHNVLYASISREIVLAMALLFFCSLAYTMSLFIRRKITLAHCFLSVLLVFIATNKVFSPQYLLWLYPLIAYLYRFHKRWVLITTTIALLTTLIYPFFYGGTTVVPYFGLQVMLASIVIRNLFFIFFTVIYLFNIFNLRNEQYEMNGQRRL